MKRPRPLPPDKTEKSATKAVDVNAAHDPDPSFAANAARELAQLEVLVAEMQARLAALHRDVADAESRLGSAQSVQIVEANEQLVLAAALVQTEPSVGYWPCELRAMPWQRRCRAWTSCSRAGISSARSS